jgi:protocatechuate 3,4-dioxygenase beta subunit
VQTWRDKRLPGCMEHAGAQILENVGTRFGEAPVYAQTVTAADGSFVLQGLPAGEFALWALGDQGAELRPGVAAGAEGVELVLGKGLVLEALVTDPSDRPLSDVQVTLLHAGHTRFFDVRTGSDGRFRMGPLPKGGYGLVAEKEGWLPEYVEPHFFQRAKRKVVLVRPGRIVGRVLSEEAPAPGAEVRAKGVDGTEQVTKADAEGRFAFERMKPIGYVLTATWKGRHAVKETTLDIPGATSSEVVLRLGSARHVEGTVRDDAGSPVAGARVTLRAPGNHQRALTDAQGQYRLEMVEVGTYSFEVDAPRYRDIREERRELTLGAGPVDFTLERAVSISGKIVDEQGRPVEGARFTLTQSTEDSAHGAEDDIRTDEDGQFVLDVARAGSWKVAIQHGQFFPQELSIQAPAEDVRWVLRKGGVVEGSVTDEKGVPLEGARVSLWKSGDSWRFQHAVQTDDQGRFSLGGLRAGSYGIEAALSGDGVDRLASRTLELRDSERVEVPLRFEPGWGFSGLVVDEAGQPLSDVSVSLEANTENPPPWSRGKRRRYDPNNQLRTAGDGRFAFRHLWAGMYTVKASKWGYTFDPSKAVGGERVEEKLQVRPGMGEVRLVLKTLARITGRVIGPDGAPIQRFEVDERFVDDESGAFAYPVVKSERKTLLFKAPGMVQVERTVEVRAGVDLDLGEVRMERGRRVTGRVVDAETGAPIASARVELEDLPQDTQEAGARSHARERTQDNGVFEFDHIESRPLALTVTRSGYITRTLTLGSGEESVTVRLDAGATVEISIRDLEGRPLDAEVVLLREGTSRTERLPVRGGSTVQRGLEPGAYLAQVLRTQGFKRAFAPQRVSIPASGRVALAFVEQGEGATVALQFEEGEEVLAGALIPGVTLPENFTLETIEAWDKFALSPEEEQGARTFRHVPAGRAVLLLIKAPPPQLHVEELDIPGGGVLKRVVRPRWQPLQKK